MLLSLFYIADAGFARFFNDRVMTPFGDGRLADFGQLYLGSDLLVLALGIYDLVRHRPRYDANDLDDPGRQRRLMRLPTRLSSSLLNVCFVADCGPHKFQRGPRPTCSSGPSATLRGPS